MVSATAQMKATQSLISQSECMGRVGGPNSTMLELPSGGTRCEFLHGHNARCNLAIGPY